MFMKNHCLIGIIFCFGILQCDINRLAAQGGRNDTILSVEIMIPKISGDLVMAQRWGKAFEEIGIGTRIRMPLPSDKPEIKETIRGPLRVVRIVGELDRKGNLSFPEKTFTLNDMELIKTWLDEIKVYGAQGSPEGKKFWGLSKDQFDSVVKALTEPVSESTQGKTLLSVIDALPVPKSSPVVIHPEAREAFFKVEAGNVSQELIGISSGTALAAALREHGFGFRPLRTPGGSIELTVEPFSEISDPWPVGWDIDDSKPRNLIAPNLYQFVKTGFEKASLERVLDAISEQTTTPILIDFALCEAKNIDISTAQVSYPEKQTAWALVLASVVRQARLTHKLMLDEAGKTFVWVAPFIPYTPKETSR